jgi:hypothetical protein
LALAVLVALVGIQRLLTGVRLHLIQFLTLQLLPVAVEVVLVTKAV